LQVGPVGVGVSSLAKIRRVEGWRSLLEDWVAGPEDVPSQNCWVFSSSEALLKKVEEDIGRSSVVGFVGRKGKVD